MKHCSLIKVNSVPDKASEAGRTLVERRWELDKKRKRIGIGNSKKRKRIGIGNSRKLVGLRGCTFN